MLAAVLNGDAKKLAELMRQGPGFDVNMNRNGGNGNTLLYYACEVGSRSAVIPLLLAHPDIDVNVKSTHGYTPFFGACYYGNTSCVRLLLKDSRVKLNDLNTHGSTPLWYAVEGYLNIIKVWIASERDMDLGTPGDYYTDAIGEAKRKGKAEIATLLERFKLNPEETRHAMRLELDCYDELAAEMFALVVFVSDGY